MLFCRSDPHDRRKHSCVTELLPDSKKKRFRSDDERRRCPHADDNGIHGDKQGKKHRKSRIKRSSKKSKK